VKRLPLLAQQNRPPVLAKVKIMARGLGLGYIPKKSPIHGLTGASKLLMVVLVSLSAMITYDTRFLIAIIAASVTMFALSRVPLSDLKIILTLIGVFMILNNVFIFLFSPEEGVGIYGARHVIAHLFGNYVLTQEQLFYQMNVTLKYFSIVPLALIFFVTTEPSEFASSLNKIGVNYKAAYSVSLALRYIPTVQREFREISQAQQARGVDTSKNVKLHQRLKGIISIIFPLIVTSIDKIETISYAMELRSFGKNKSRTWYRYRGFRTADYFVIIVSASLIAVSVYLNILNDGRFYNPFV
jgi:energy-coupling factor transport system permease protein